MSESKRSRGATKHNVVDGRYLGAELYDTLQVRCERLETDNANSRATIQRLMRENRELKKRPDIEVLSALVHDAWMVEQQKLGRTTRRSQSGEEFMVPYDALSEEAKEFDRAR